MASPTTEEVARRIAARRHVHDPETTKRVGAAELTLAPARSDAYVFACSCGTTVWVTGTELAAEDL